MYFLKACVVLLVNQHRGYNLAKNHNCVRLFYKRVPMEALEGNFDLRLMTCDLRLMTYD